MTDILRSWILGLAGTALICAAATLLTPGGQVKKVVQLLCGVAMTVALLSPLAELDLSDYGLNLSKYRAGAAELTSQAAALRQSLDRSIIEEKLEAYILDKAQSLGADVTAAEVTMQWSTEGFWYPVRAQLQGTFHGQLSRLLEAELGIPESAQTWRNDEDP